ncbi:hypothetical protein N665_0364s0005 [Sinapis alba]|nr:hypothetical protein N665_0364s0005 [Sinapis alba]
MPSPNGMSHYSDELWSNLKDSEVSGVSLQKLLPVNI